MTTQNFRSQHSFHVPVMGIGFTIDTPIRLAPLGIDSSISLVNDDVIESARSYHCRQRLLPYEPIAKAENDSRARRITAYLNLVQDLVDRDSTKLRESSFDDPQGIARYFHLLPSDNPLRKAFFEAYDFPPGSDRDVRLEALRRFAVPGTVGVNIMTKLDGPLDEKGETRPPHHSEAQAALRGFAQSRVRGPLILSAGANPSLFAYLGEFDDFFPDERGHFVKPIVIKVSDYRSAYVQGRMLARRGIWVSEFRIESGLNCGGHAFPTEGKLMGPILREFQLKRAELQSELFAALRKGLLARGGPELSEPPQLRITAQGGIGTFSEDAFLRGEFGLDGTGWGTPFLLVPEAVRMDAATTNALVNAQSADIQLSWSSPLGVRFWWLRTAPSETARQERIREGLPGSVCTARHIALNTEFGKVPLCAGSRAYQKRKKATFDPDDPDYEKLVERLEAPACICVDLCGAYLECSSDEEAPPAAVCPGPNLVNFQKVYQLEEMVGHIYGRIDVSTSNERPHMFVRELELYLDVQEEELVNWGTKLQTRSDAQLEETFAGLHRGLDFYRDLASRLPTTEHASFLRGLESAEARLNRQRDHFRRASLSRASTGGAIGLERSST